jgi:propionyl-CoA carboxylase alpha chain
MNSMPTIPAPPPVIRRLLIANRGEIARRVIATCRTMGIETVAVYSDADAASPHVAEADLAVRLPGAAAAETYLRADLLVEAARRTGADAVHPGYGFLAENAEFATAVTDAGLTWVGPPAKAIAAMGSKVEAKALLAEAGVPMLPSWTRPGDVETFPVLVKASAGGGGRGMRVVATPEELEPAWAAASREALAAFGDGSVFAERYLPAARHIEVQVIADTQGTVVALGERECSIQRRHQKIIEEAPSPAVNATLRQALFDAAVAAARAVGYVNAGTVEFLLHTDTGEFFFLEMNTRLQVEHPVTECVTGLDLVRLQLMVAEGEALPFDTPPPVQGHAIEVRLYAEDPGQDWLPATGTLHRFTVPHAATFDLLPRPGTRLDSAVADGSTISAHYDSMLAKIIAWSPDRAQAARALATTLRRAHLHGVTTNRDLLVRVLRDPEFLSGQTDTAYLERRPEVFLALLDTVDDQRLAALAAALAGSVDPAAPWRALPSGWRNVASGPQRVSFTAPSGVVEVSYRLDRSGQLAEWSVDGQTQPVTLLHRDPGTVVLEVAGVRHAFDINRTASASYVDSARGSVALGHLPSFPESIVESHPGSLLAPMPGTVGRVLVAPGAVVAAGDPLLTIEAMKMEHIVRAPEAGVVAEIRVRPGDQTEPGTPLAVLAAREE